MARNRKYRSAAIRFGPALKAFLLCLLLAGSGVGYVWQKNQIYELGRQIKQRESRLASLESQNREMRQRLGDLGSPLNVERCIRIWNLGLVQPLPSQVWRLPEPLRESSSSDGPAQLAER
jgi:hypothetical protein